MYMYLIFASNWNSYKFSGSVRGRPSLSRLYCILIIFRGFVPQSNFVLPDVGLLLHIIITIESLDYSISWVDFIVCIEPSGYV
jgi:hypothetical protein